MRRSIALAAAGALAAAALAWLLFRPACADRPGESPALGPEERLDDPLSLPPPDPQDLVAFQARVQAVYKRVAPSTVNLFAEPKHQHMGSGVVIDVRGDVLTHAHHGLAPGAAVTAVFHDGRKVAGQLLGVHEPFDLSLVRLAGEGPWPAVPLGRPAGLKAGEPCVMLGYPKMHHQEGHPPLLRLGRFARSWAHYLLTSCNLNGGDSGGPLFGLDGALLGNHNLKAHTEDGESIVRGAGHTSVEYFAKDREELLAGRHVRWTGGGPQGRGEHPIVGPFDGVTGLDGLANVNRKAVLSVLDGDVRVAF